MLHENNFGDKVVTGVERNPSLAAAAEMSAQKCSHHWALA